MNKFRHFLILVAMEGLSLLVFFPTLKLPLLDDDYSDLRYLYLLFHGHSELLHDTLFSSYINSRFGLHYRPFLLFWQSLEWLFCGANSFCLHLANVLVHGLNSFLFFAAGYQIFRLFKAPQAFRLAFLSSILFAVHPFHVENMSWLVSALDMFCGTWYLSSLWSFASYLESGSRIKLIVAAGSCLLALGTKESAISLPVALTMLAFLSQEKQDWTNLKESVRKSQVFWLISIGFIIIRAFCLKSIVGGYYGADSADRMGTIFNRFVETNVLQILCYPIYQSANLAQFLNPSLAIIYLLSALILIVSIGAVKSHSQALRTIIFSGLFVIVSLLPICYVWVPAHTLLNSRLLYLPSMGLCWLFCAVLFAVAATDREQAFRHLLVLALTAIFIFSDFESHSRWSTAGRISSSLISQTASLMGSLPAEQELVHLGMPNYFQGVAIFYSIESLQDAFKEPFTKHSAPPLLNALEPHYFSNSLMVNISRLRRLATEPAKYKAVDCTINPIDSSLKLQPFELQRFAAKTPVADLLISGDQIQPNTIGKLTSYDLSFAPPFDSATYQFVTLTFKHSESNPLNHFSFRWSGSNPGTYMPNFVPECRSKRNGDQTEITVHVGEILDWIRSKQTQGLQVFTDNGMQLESIQLSADTKFVPSLVRTPGKCIELIGGAITPLNNNYYLDYDASQIPKAEAVRLEIAPIATALNAHRLSDPEFSKHTEKTIVLSALKGTLCLPDTFSANPCWRQIRIISTGKNGEPVGFSSDPIYVRTAPF